MEKSCFNCEHFARYSVRTGIRFREIKQGHCCYDLRRKVELCENWQDNEESRQKFENSKNQVLEKISKQLYDIILHGYSNNTI
ncbi:MAG: hypothetical protein FWE22_07105 [Firmicutes bacterium]|nr:hypothetical protein [Bacillota bacterium]